MIDNCSCEFVTVDGVNLSIKRFGRGAPVVCLSAIGHDAFDFVPLAERLGHKFEFICVEWPGHGDSSSDQAPASAAHYAELLQAVLSHLSISNPILIGNSIGGAAGILCAANRPIRALILCDSGGLVAIDATVSRICGAFTKFFRAGARGALWFKPLFALYLRFVLQNRAARAQRRRMVSQAYKLAPVLAQAWSSFGQADADIRQIAEKLSLPIWVAWAKRDVVIPLNACLPAIKRLRNAQFDTFAAGHSAFLEQPDAFAAKFDHFISMLPGRRCNSPCLVDAAA